MHRRSSLQGLSLCFKSAFSAQLKLQGFKSHRFQEPISDAGHERVGGTSWRNYFRTSNPALSQSAFETEGLVLGERMTVSGTVNKTGILLICTVATAAWTWSRVSNVGIRRQRSRPSLARSPGTVGGFMVALVTIFKKSWAPVLAPIYALLEGLVLGGVSAMAESRFRGVPMQAVALTFGTTVALLLLTGRE